MRPACDVASAPLAAGAPAFCPHGLITSSGVLTLQSGASAGGGGAGRLSVERVVRAGPAPCGLTGRSERTWVDQMSIYGIHSS